jgi:alkanesulfonate monooxygenase SsuD/methylene tetrahydromethanopterin reductase-like flavin-dependent oxidoreductase (luciferase family)
LLSLSKRFDRFEEGLQVIQGLLQSDDPVDFYGQYYRLQDAVLLPRPQRPGGPPILIGGNGERRTLPLVARFASEWNGVYITADEYQRLNVKLDQLLLAQERQPSDVRRSLMTGCILGRSRSEIERKATEHWGGKHSPKELKERGLVVGEISEITEQVQALSESGVERVMLQWLDQDNFAGLEILAKGIIR